MLKNGIRCQLSDIGRAHVEMVVLEHDIGRVFGALYLLRDSPGEG
jgi:hypothetical protein